MEQVVNYQKQLDSILTEIKGRGSKPRLLLHACCGPCSTYVIEYLTEFFDITIFFYNPNIHPKEEYIKRLETIKKFIQEFPLAVQNKIQFVEIDWDNKILELNSKAIDCVWNGMTLTDEVKDSRRDEIMELQQAVSYDLSEKRVGRVYRTFIEGRDTKEDVYVGRTYMDAPGVDGYVFIKTDENLMSGDFIDVKITDFNEYDLIGEPVNV